MSIPSMTPDNRWSRIVGRLAAVERGLAELRSALGTLGSATISGALKVAGGGSISVGENGTIWMSPGGRFFVAGDSTYVQILEDSFSIGTVAFDGTLTRPSMIMRPDGFLAAITDALYAVFRVDATDGAAVVTSSQGSVRLPYQTTSSAANCRILFDGTIQQVTSSLRYKFDPQPVAIDLDDVRRMRGRTWLDRATRRRLAEVPFQYANIGRDVGFIAEELDALESLRQFVDYDEQGRPDAVQYDRLSVALLELLLDVDTRVADQQTQIDRLTARLDALEPKVA